MVRPTKTYVRLLPGILLLFVLPALKGQNYHFSNLHENYFLYNPAGITRVEKMAFQGSYRNQWPGNSDFVNYNAAFIWSAARLKSSAGLNVIRDMQGEGIIAFTRATIFYGYRTHVSRELMFAAGLTASYSDYRTHFSGLTYEGGGIPDIVTNAGFYYSIDFSTGVELIYRERNRFGLAVTDITAYHTAPTGFTELSLVVSYSGNYSLTRRFSRQSIFIEPLFYSHTNLHFNELLYGSRIRYESVYGGLYFRQNLRFQFDAAIILLGTRFGNASLFYTYDINLSGLNSNFTNLAAHEVTFLYNMEYNKKSKKRGAIKCPDI